MLEAMSDGDTGSPSERTLTDATEGLKFRAKSGDSSFALGSAVDRMCGHPSVSSEVQEVSAGAGFPMVVGSKRSQLSASDTEPEDNHLVKRAKGEEKLRVWTALENEDDYGWD